MKKPTRKRILLFNPPGKKRYLRDYWDSTVSKAGYYWPPIDLLILSGILKSRYDVFVLDALVERKSVDKCSDMISVISPDIVIFMSSVLSRKEDFEFAARLKKEYDSLIIIGCGEVFLEDTQGLLKEHPFIDAAILDFTNSSIPDFIEDLSVENNVMSFNENGYVRDLEYPIPLHGKFPLHKYSYPYNTYKPFTSVLSSYGCPYKCHFCNSGNLGFKLRNIDNVIEELKYVGSMGIKQVFFADMTFAAKRSHAMDLCRKISKNNIRLRWNCYSRADVIDEELLVCMKRAGCYLIQFGVENFDESFLKKHGKSISVSRTLETFDLLKKHGLLAGAHFLFGLPGESSGSIKDSIEFAKSMNPDYVSFNIFRPRKNTFLSSEEKTLGADKIFKSIRNGYLDFYLRPRYLFERISRISTLYELKNIIYNGVILCRNVIMGTM
ncbi:B12-binding domain-containing radical SAM protein [Elusimicrobiota bacterium]